MPPSKVERIDKFFAALELAAAAKDADEAINLVRTTLNAVEDQYSGAPYEPANHLNDGRLYPPADDNRRTVENRPDLSRYRSAGHNTFIGANGAILIKRITGTGKEEICFSKPGADGKKVEI